MLQDQPLISKLVPTLTPLYPRVRRPGHPCLQRTFAASAAWQSDLTPLPSLGHKALRSCLGHPSVRGGLLGNLNPDPYTQQTCCHAGGWFLIQFTEYEGSSGRQRGTASVTSYFFPTVKGGHSKPHRGSGLTQAPGAYLF